MAVKLFASILIGSTETEMKLFQLSPRKGMLQLSCQSRRIDLGSDAYARGTLSTQKVELLVRTLKSFKKTMDGYHVDSYRMVATSAIRELRTALITNPIPSSGFSTTSPSRWTRTPSRKSFRQGQRLSTSVAIPSRFRSSITIS